MRRSHWILPLLLLLFAMLACNFPSLIPPTPTTPVERASAIPPTPSPSPVPPTAPPSTAPVEKASSTPLAPSPSPLPPTAPPPTATSTASPAPTSTPLPSATPPPSPTTVPLWQRIHIEDRLIDQTNEEPPYTLTARYPALVGSDDVRLQRFNQDIETLVQDEIATFQSDVSGMPVPPATSGSFFESGYQVLSPPGNLLSILLQFSLYMDGAAHPFGYSKTYTFDIENGVPLALNDLFTTPDALPWIAAYCQAELASRDIGYFGSGAEPTLENYRNWNLTATGLQITFDPYQVAPYAVGPQTVTIPYSDLAVFLRPEIAAQLPMP